MTAIVASGYLFADELAYHVDVYQGDTPATLLERHAPGATVKNAAVIDIDIPGNTEPLPLEADEPVVVVGNSPRTSVFVCGESGCLQEEKGCRVDHRASQGTQSPEPISSPPKTHTADSAGVPELTTSHRVKNPAPAPAKGDEDDDDGTTEIEVEDLAPPSEDTTADPSTPVAESAERPFSRTRRAPKSKANRHTRRIPHVPRLFKIELV